MLGLIAVMETIGTVEAMPVNALIESNKLN